MKVNLGKPVHHLFVSNMYDKFYYNRIDAMIRYDVLMQVRTRISRSMIDFRCIEREFKNNIR